MNEGKRGKWSSRRNKEKKDTAQCLAYNTLLVIRERGKKARKKYRFEVDVCHQERDDNLQALC